MQVQVLFFGGLREALGCAVVDVSAGESAAGGERAAGGESAAGGERSADEMTLSLVELEERIAQLHPRFESLRRGVRIAVNESFVETTQGDEIRLRDGDVIAYIPPVTGG